MRITDICMNCGARLAGHSCALCGARVCNSCFNPMRMVCVKCLSKRI